MVTQKVNLLKKQDCPKLYMVHPYRIYEVAAGLDGDAHAFLENSCGAQTLQTRLVRSR